MLEASETTTAPASLDLRGLGFAELERALFALGIKPVHARAVWAAVHRRFATAVEVFDGVPSAVRERLRAVGAVAGALPVVRAEASTDGQTRKFLLGLADGEMIETVVMRFSGRRTACVSTQVGCAMGCVFCATGQGGFRRHLTAGEIVAQVLHVAREVAAEGERLRNVVLMGQGEPLHNYEAVLRAVDIMVEVRGLALAAKRVTLSTVGLVPGIRRLAQERRAVSLAVSLHGATDEARAALVPAGRRWPLAELMEACRFYSDTTGSRIFFEWTLIEGRNDGAEDAHALGRLLAGQQGQVNLIPLNPTAGYGGTPTVRARALAFQEVLRGYGIASTVRQRRGIDIAAGCGQLAGAEGQERRVGSQ